MRERRQVPRYLLTVPAKLSQPIGGAASAVTVLSISVHGASIEGVAGLGPGQKCGLSLEWRGAQIRAAAEVVWKRKDGTAGLKFHAIEKESLELLRELCATLQLQPLTPLPPDD